MNAHEQNWRWLCVECETEGRGWRPEKCPTCERTDSWYLNNAIVYDPRTMTQILTDDIFGHLKDKNNGQ